ncbi:DUF3885 domain-containing protein [Paenibacillus glacialis]|uniref:DUF3885 domain-containing protein n=1 Tax=Paenibacillus glacialis TaxID=494026 RepID=A0A168HM02_9BACL|nr:DUF3885 domain-containing protein [Paenibacillus glacialis]OAB38320.1 hypothetical protein PGLA_19655 [Paenibacillus glacialis]
MIREIIEYFDNNFPDIGSDIHVRFELGEPFRNGSNRRIKQVNKRVVAIFEETFNQSDFIYVLIKDWGNKEDPMFGNTTPEYIYELLNGKRMEEETLFELDEDEDDEGNKIEIKHEYQVKVSEGLVSSFRYKEILEGISHYEQGRKPSIGQRVYFISENKEIVFNMYDDRGCIIYSISKEQIRHLYVKYNDWIVNYHREYFDSLFKEV